MKSSTKKNQKRIDHNNLVIGKVLYKYWREYINLTVTTKKNKSVKLKSKIVEWDDDVMNVSHIYYYGETEVMRVISNRTLGKKHSVILVKGSPLYEKLCKLSIHPLYYKYVRRVVNITYEEFRKNDYGFYMDIDMLQKLHNYIMKKNEKTFGSFLFCPYKNKCSQIIYYNSV